MRVQTAISRLRALIEPVPSEPRHLLSEGGHYWLSVTDLSEIECPEQAPPPLTRSTLREREALFGRDALLAQLEATLADNPGVLTLLGPGGVGKTSLLQALAGRLRGRGEALEFVDLSSSTELLSMYSQLAKQLALPLNDGDDLGERLTLRGTRLLLLDNVERLAALLPGPLTTWREQAPELQVVLTSRVPLEPSQGISLTIPPLDLPSALELLEARVCQARHGRLIGAEEEPALAQIAGALGGSPLALEMAAAQADLYALQDLAAALQQHPLRLEAPSTAPARHRSLRSNLELSWALLKPDLRETIEALAVFEGAFTLSDAERLLGEMKPNHLPGDARALLQRGLLHRADSDQLSLETSLRLFARERWSDARRSQLHRQHLAFFSELGAELGASDTLSKELRSQRSRLAEGDLLAACRRGLSQGAHRAAARALFGLVDNLLLRGPQQLGITLLSQLSSAGEGLDPDTRCRVEFCLLQLLSKDHPRQAEEALGRLEALAPDDAGLRLLVLKGRMLVRAPRLTRTELSDLMVNILAMARAGGSLIQEAVALGNQALADLWGARYEAAEERCIEALGLYRETEDRIGQALIHNILGLTFKRMGALTRARFHLETSLRLARESGAAKEEACALGNLGNLLRETGEPVPAEAYTRDSIALNRVLGRRAGLAVQRGNLGISLWQQGRVVEAHVEYRAALRELSALGDRWSQSLVLRDIGLLKFQAGDYPGAHRAFEQGLLCLRASQRQQALGTLLVALGKVAHELGDLSGARRRREEALAEIDRTPGTWGKLSALILGAELTLEEDRPGPAAAEAERALELSRSQRSRREECSCLQLLAAAALRQGEPARELLSYAQRIARELGDTLAEARCALALAEERLRVGDHAAAQDLLTPAGLALRRLGARPLLADCFLLEARASPGPEAAAALSGARRLVDDLKLPQGAPLSKRLRSAEVALTDARPR